LDRLHVLVTRTGDEGRALADKVRDQGLAALHLPLVRLLGPVDPERILRQFALLPRPDGLILTSREGVRQAAGLGFLQILKNIPTVVPGRGTRSLALAMGLEQVHCPSAPAGNSEAMLAMEVLQGVAGQRWLVLAADDGRRLLDATLQARGAQVDRLTVYRRVPEPPDPAALELLEEHAHWITLVASGSALDRLASDLPRALWDKLCCQAMIVPSDLLRLRAGEHGASRVILSAGASDRDMLEALRGSTSAS
jgi:uroporphyrinogen-III synthase